MFYKESQKLWRKKHEKTQSEAEGEARKEQDGTKKEMDIIEELED